MSILTDDTGATIADTSAPVTEDSLVASLVDRWSAKPKGEETPDAVVEDPEAEGYEADGEPVDEDGEETEGGEPEDPNAPPAKDAEAPAKTDETPKAEDGPKEIADDMVAKVTVDGKELEITGAQLKRLAGQEAALTQKSQKVTDLGLRTQNVLNNALAIAKQDLDEYEGVDWLVEKDRMDPEWFEYHRGRAAVAEQRFGHLLNSYQQVQQDKAVQSEEITAEMKAAAQETLKAAIPEWSEVREAQNVAYMVSQGIDEASAKALLVPEAKILVDKARLYDEGKALAAQKAAKVPQKQTLAPAGASQAEVKTKATQDAESRLKGGKGSDDDAVAVLMGRWSRNKS